MRYPTTCSCLGLNALLALPTKEGGNKGIEFKKGAINAVQRKKIYTEEFSLGILNNTVADISPYYCVYTHKMTFFPFLSFLPYTKVRPSLSLLPLSL